MSKKRKLLRLALFGTLIAWLVGRKRKSPPPEGEWRDYVSETETTEPTP